MMIIVVVLYLICWLPVYMSVLLLFVVRVQVNDIFFFYLTILLTLWYGWINPYVYYLILSENLRNGLRKTEDIEYYFFSVQRCRAGTKINAEPICF